MNTPVGSIYTTTALKAFKTLEEFVAGQYLLGIGDINLGDGAKITFANFILSMISADSGNLLEVGADNLLKATTAEIDFDDINDIAKVIFGETEYGGTIVDNLNTINKSGFYTSYGTGTGVPTSGYSWFIIHQNSNVGTASATQRAVAYNSVPIIYDRVKTGSTWGDWTLQGSGSGGGATVYDPQGTVTTNITLAENKITTGHWSGSNTITLPNITDTTKQVVCVLDFTTASSSQPTITNTNLKWSEKTLGKPPASYSTVPGLHNVLTFTSMWEGGILFWKADYSTFGANIIDLVQPVLSVNGTLGSIVQVAIGNNGATYLCMDGNNSTYSYINYNSGGVVISFPKPTKLTSVSFRFGSYYPQGCTFYGSMDGVTYTSLQTGGYAQTVNMSIPSNVQNFYRYYKFYAANSDHSNGDLYEIGLVGKQINQNYIN